MAKSRIKPSELVSSGATDFAEKMKAVTQNMVEETKVEEEKKVKEKEVQLVNFNLPKAKYEEYKKMFGAEGFSFARGTRMVLDFVLREIQDGNLELTESGFRKTLLSKVIK